MTDVPQKQHPCQEDLFCSQTQRSRSITAGRTQQYILVQCRRWPGEGSECSLSAGFLFCLLLRPSGLQHVAGTPKGWGVTGQSRETGGPPRSGRRSRRIHHQTSNAWVSLLCQLSPFPVPCPRSSFLVPAKVSLYRQKLQMTQRFRDL